MKTKPPAHRLNEVIGKGKPIPMGLVEACGVQHSTVYRWRQGAAIRSDKVVIVADYFGVTTDYLLGRSAKEEK